MHFHWDIFRLLSGTDIYASQLTKDICCYKPAHNPEQTPGSLLSTSTHNPHPPSARSLSLDQMWDLKDKTEDDWEKVDEAGGSLIICVNLYFLIRDFFLSSFKLLIVSSILVTNWAWLKDVQSLKKMATVKFLKALRAWNWPHVVLSRSPGLACGKVTCRHLQLLPTLVQCCGFTLIPRIREVSLSFH